MKFLLALLMTFAMTAQATVLAPDWSGYSDSGAQAIKFTDTDGSNDDSTFSMTLEDAGYAPNNTMGLYIYDVAAGAQKGGYFEIFSGAQAAGDWTSLLFDFSLNSITKITATTSVLYQSSLVTDLTTLNVSNLQIGVYLQNQPGDYFYSHDNLNADGLRHVGIYETPGVFDLVFAWDDQLGGGDRDFNDMVVSATDVAIDVPEPGTLALLGLAALGLRLRKRKI